MSTKIRQLLKEKNVVVVHHTGEDELKDMQPQDAEHYIRGWHKHRGWTDTGYNFVTTSKGTVQGRPMHNGGAHALGYNDCIGWVICGDYRERGPQVMTLNRMRVAALAFRELGIMDFVPHNALGPTECPGRQLEWHMKSIIESQGSTWHSRDAD